VANIAKDADGTVHGALFEMSEKDLEHLAGLEGSQGYSQVDVSVEHEGVSKMARTFISTNTTLGQPSDDYLNTMKLGAKDCKLPKKYTESLEV
ncbi:MAG: gamma-glutamylcyclotransferase, partial [Candidatus Saccharimonadales bacterium]